MKVARALSELEPAPRAVALGTFDGVHLGHRRVIETARDTGLRSTVVTFDLIRELPSETASICSRRSSAGWSCSQTSGSTKRSSSTSRSIWPGSTRSSSRTRCCGRSTRNVVAGEDFRFGRGRRGDLDTLLAHGFEVRPVELLEGVFDPHSRGAPRGARRRVSTAARPSVRGRGDSRRGRCARRDGVPTANLAVRRTCSCLPSASTRGSAFGHRAAISIGTNPHYGGRERRVEPHLLDFEGDLYGLRLLVELWQRLRDERAFESEEELIAEIARDVEKTRNAVRPA